MSDDREPSSAKRVHMTMRLAPSVRAELERVAAENGRSLTQEAESRLSQSFRESALHAILLGGDRSAKLLQYISTVMKTSVSKDGKTWENDPALANTVGMALYYLTISCSRSHLDAIGMMRDDKDLERRILYAAQTISNYTILSYGADIDPSIIEGREGTITAPQAIQRFIVDGEKV